MTGMMNDLWLASFLTQTSCFRFGPHALQWQHCSTVREYMHQGLMHSAGFHVVSGAILLLMSAFGGKSPVTFVRSSPRSFYPCAKLLQ